jgi:hypothetical protein
MDANTPYSTGEATDMAVMLLMRKLRRGLSFEVALAQLPDGAREALAHAEQCGDDVRFADQAAGIGFGDRPWPTRFADLDD